MLTITEIAKLECVVPTAVRKWITEGLGKSGQKEKLIAFKTKKGARNEWRIKRVDYINYKKKYLT